MMDINTSSQQPPVGILNFFPAVKKMGLAKRECCADAFLRMVSDSPPGQPESCLVARAQCPFKLARPTPEKAPTLRESPRLIATIAADVAIVPRGITGTILIGVVWAKLIITALFAGGAIMIRSRYRRRRRRRRNTGGEGSPAPTTGTQSSNTAGEVVPMLDGQALAWEAPFATCVNGSD